MSNRIIRKVKKIERQTKSRLHPSTYIFFSLLKTECFSILISKNIYLNILCIEHSAHLKESMSGLNNTFLSLKASFLILFFNANPTSVST